MISTFARIEQAALMRLRTFEGRTRVPKGAIMDSSSRIVTCSWERIDTLDDLRTLCRANRSGVVAIIDEQDQQVVITVETVDRLRVITAPITRTSHGRICRIGAPSATDAGPSDPRFMRILGEPTR